MNIKNRLNSTNQNNSGGKQAYLNHYKKDIFNGNTITINILLKEINALKNIIFVCDKDCDKKVITDSLKDYIARSLPVCYPTNKNDFKHNAINILPDIAGNEFVNVLEASLKGVKSFICGLNLKNYDNITDKLRAVIALSSPIADKHIDTLLASSESILVHVSCYKGIYSIRSIDKIDSEFSVLAVKNLYKNLSDPANEVMLNSFNNSYIEEKENISDNSVTAEDILTDSAENTESSYSVMSEADTKEEYSVENNSDESYSSESNTEDEKENKYKILRERIRQRKQSGDI